jgi:hypothetical protein
MFTQKAALQTLQEHNQEAHVLFVDLAKAYDTVNQELLWKILARLGIPPKMIVVLQKLYAKVTYHMNVDGRKKSFEITCGVKQGNNLGPILFLFMIQAISTTMDKKWDFKTPDFRWHGMKKDGNYKYNPNLGKGSSTTKGTHFSLWKLYDVDDAAFLFLNREDIEQAEHRRHRASVKAYHEPLQALWTYRPQRRQDSKRTFKDRGHAHPPSIPTINC